MLDPWDKMASSLDMVLVLGESTGDTDKKVGDQDE